MTYEEKYELVKVDGVQAVYPNVYYIASTQQFTTLTDWIAGETPVYDFYDTLREAVSARSGWAGEHLERKCREWEAENN